MKATRILLFFGIAAVASATSVTATFNFSGVAENATAAQISTYMTTTLQAAGCTGCTVTVTGAVADTTYNGEGYATGPTNSPSRSLTLGTSTGATASNTNSTINAAGVYDTFIANTNDSSGNLGTQITVKFSGFTINGTASFDYEIFPDGTCTALNATNCGGAAVGGIYPNQPDLKLEAGTNSSGTDPVVTSFGTNGIQYGVTPGTTNGNATVGPNGTISAPQYIGTWTTASALNGTNELDFIDWPATIGVDNLVLTGTTTTSAVPDPSSVLLFGTVVAGIALRKKFRKTA